MPLVKFESSLKLFLACVFAAFSLLFSFAVVFKPAYIPGFSVIRTLEDTEDIKEANSRMIVVDGVSDPKTIIKTLSVQGLENLMFDETNFGLVSDWSKVRSGKLHKIELSQCSNFDFETIDALCSCLGENGRLEIAYKDKRDVRFLDIRTIGNLERKYKIIVHLEKYPS